MWVWSICGFCSPIYSWIKIGMVKVIFCVQLRNSGNHISRALINTCVVVEFSEMGIPRWIQYKTRYRFRAPIRGECQRNFLIYLYFRSADVFFHSKTFRHRLDWLELSWLLAHSDQSFSQPVLIGIQRWITHDGYNVLCYANVCYFRVHRYILQCWYTTFILPYIRRRCRWYPLSRAIL